MVDGRGNAYVNNVGFDLMADEEVRPGHVVMAGPDGSVRTLFVTAAQWRPDLPELVPPGSGQVHSVRVPVPGAGWP